MKLIHSLLAAHARWGRRLGAAVVPLLLGSILVLGSTPAHAARIIDSATLNGAASVTVAPAASITAVVSVTTTGTGSANNWRSTGWRIATSAPGAMTCVNHPNHDNAGSYSETFTITAPATDGSYDAYFIAYSDEACSQGASATVTLAGGVVVATPPPVVTSISRASFDPTKANTVVAWTVVFSRSVSGVDAADFALVPGGGVTGAGITSVSGSGTTWTVTANTGTGVSGSLGLNLVDNDTIVSGSVPLGGTGAGNGSFAGQSYTLIASVCTGAADILFCDDFERANPGTVGNGWSVTPANITNCTGAAGNTGCAGIDSDIPPYTTYTNPRANPTRAMFTRWSIVSVDSPVIDLAGRSGGQLSYWMRRGSDAFSEYPEATGENYLVQYYASDGSWKILAQYPSGIAQGQIYTPTIELPPDALHAGFRLRFYQPSGSGKTGSGGAAGVVGYDYWHMDDVVVREVAAPRFTGAFCDNFEAGLGRWSVSAEGAPAGANIGDASIGSLAYQSATRELDLRWGYVSAATFKTDMTGVSGNITYWVRSGTTAGRDPATDQNLVVEYQNSAGAWTTLATYLGAAAAGTTYNGTHVLPADARHANFRLRLRQLAGSGYDTSYWHVDDVCVGDLLPTADLALVKTGDTLVPGSNTTYTLRVTNNGPGALSGSVSVVDTLPGGLSYLAGSGTSWVCSAAGQLVTCDWSGSLASGALAPDLTLTVAVAASLTGSVTNTATATGTVNDPNLANNTSAYTSGNFIPAYVFTDQACVDGIPIGQPGQVCNRVNWSGVVAGGDKAGIYITAVNSSGVPTRLSAAAATTVGLQFGLTCHNPTVNAGVQATFSAAAAALPLCTGNGAEPTSWTATSNLIFAAGAPSVATPYTFNYADVGAVELFVRNAAAVAQKGSSGRFVVRPAGFVLSEIKPTASPAGRCAVGTTPAPAVTCASTAADAAVFVRAGEDFSVTVTAVTASGAAAPNYGKETSPESVRLVPASVIASMASTPAVLGSFGAFSAGGASGTAFTWAEVGIITLTPQVADGDYLGAGNVIGTPSGNVGRFIPDHFDTEVTQGCAAGGFTYSGQPFTARVTARNRAGNTTVNYVGSATAASSFARATTLSNAGSTANLSNNTIPALDFAAGVAVNNRLTYTFPVVQTAPLSLTIGAQDSDGVSSAAVEGTAQIRSGRVRLLNAYGSEFLNLPLPLRLEFWDGNGWVANGSDSCTALAAGNFAFAFPAGTAARPNNLAACETALTLTGAAPNYVLTLRRPGAGNNGWADLTLNLGAAALGGNTQCTVVGGAGPADVPANLPWLQHDWDGTGAGNPRARATFGVYRSPLIYRRENY